MSLFRPRPTVRCLQSAGLRGCLCFWLPLFLGQRRSLCGLSFSGVCLVLFLAVCRLLWFLLPCAPPSFSEVCAGDPLRCVWRLYVLWQAFSGPSLIRTPFPVGASGIFVLYTCVPRFRSRGRCIFCWVFVCCFVLLNANLGLLFRACRVTPLILRGLILVSRARPLCRLVLFSYASL